MWAKVIHKVDFLSKPIKQVKPIKQIEPTWLYKQMAPSRRIRQIRRRLTWIAIKLIKSIILISTIKPIRTNRPVRRKRPQWMN